MPFHLVLTKMLSELSDPVRYYLISDNNFININQLLNKELLIEHIGYYCSGCKSEKKIFRQGFCHDCFYSSPLAGDWIMKPELSTAHLDIEDRDLDYEKQVQLQPHIVYLALSSELKVGVTRKSQIPYRWIDQGAVEALPILEVPNRYLAGITEVSLKKYFADKTNYRKMLQNEISYIDLLSEKRNLRKWLPEEALPFYEDSDKDVIKINYPVLEYPKKVQSLNLNTNPIYQGLLKGIKGQYLIFEDQTVLNIRTYEGFKIRLDIK